MKSFDINNKNKNPYNEKYFKKSDLVLLAVLILIGIALTVWIYLPARTSGGSASGTGLVLEIRQNGTTIQTLSLDQKDYSQTITSASGGHNTFTINDGVVEMTDADCGDHTCINTGRIQKAGESIVCLPHRLVLQIVADDGVSDKTDAPDSVPDIVVH